VIEVEGVMVQRVLVTELAHRLIYVGVLDTASRLLHGLAHEPQIELTDADRKALCDIFPDSPVGLEALWSVICLDDHPLIPAAAG